ncbi:Protein of unknown function [Bhargavaea ginsengi]|uniref:DUF3048 domain-containing protein n=1 Tax=Bhargavaea ginsengi TaxID=426757 RepID=A0A1H7AZ37_9BACL|nr:DUF3048 domain-containing protein [Bhargavaea ginsengi]SEJ70853.1 Protein of unknown function [Bhargavaea ginsengi]
MKRRNWIAAAAVAVLLAGCAESTAEEHDDRDVPVTENEEKPDEAIAEITYTAPFTGLESEDSPDMRPVIATINNHPKARPQSGLSEADVVYEMLAEGDITRLLALYQSELPESIGPVRSARDYFVELAAAHDALYLAHGYSPDAEALLGTGVVDHLNGMRYDGTLFMRSADRVAPHNSYITGDAVMEGAKDSGFRMDRPDPPDWAFDATPQPGGEPAGVAEVSYGGDAAFTSRYAFDPAESLYSRESGGAETEDLDDGEAVRLSNILVLQVPHRIVDGQGRRALDFGAGGTALVFRDGKVYENQWESRDGIPAVMDGTEPFPLAPGKTWVHFVPESPASHVIYTP